MNQDVSAELFKKTVKELKTIAKDRSIKGCAGLKKDELIKKILEATPPTESKPLTVKELRMIARDRGINGYYKLKKDELVRLISEPQTPPGSPPQTPSSPPREQKTLLTNIKEYAKPALTQVKKAFDWSRKAAVNLDDFINKNLTGLINWTNKPLTKPKYPTKSLSDYVKEELKERKNTYEIIKTREVYRNNFTTRFEEFRIVNHGILPCEVYDIFMKILLKVIKDGNLVKNDRIRMILDHESWMKPFSTNLLRVGIDEDAIVKFILNKYEYKDVPINEVRITVHSTALPRGTGRLTTVKTNLPSKRCVITIKNDDTICLARAIVTAAANINKDKWTKNQLQNGFNKSRKLQREEALKLHEEAGVDINPHGNDIEDVEKFANYLGIQINIIDGDQFNKLIYSSEPQDTNIYLYKDKNHFDVITSMPAFLCKAYYCHSCKKAYTKRDCHKCPDKCVACFKYKSNCSKDPKKYVLCMDCNRTFFGMSCYNEHKRNRAPKDGKIDIVCLSVRKCYKCRRNITESLDDHVCGHSTCSNCGAYCDMKEHLCYMKNKQCKGGRCTGCDDPDNKCYSCKTYTEKYIFYDFETTQETGTHIVNYAHAWDFNNDEWTFDNIDDFCKFFFTEERKGYTFIAHNAKGYDAQFILKYCVENGVKPYCVYAGTKIMSMTVKEYKIRFIDSINFVASALSSFPKTFGLKELKKGYFPHFFNKPNNQNYIGPIPNKKYYNYDQMSISNRKAFLEWYNDKVSEQYVFDFNKELKEYCRADVDILRRSMMKFREDFIALENIDPLQYVTIASVCMAIYRSNYMPHYTIAVHKDTTRNEAYSQKSISWLNYLSEKHNIKIQHALNGGEYEINDMKVDGYCEETNTVYEFQGCFWHGCTKCYTGDKINPKNKLDMATLQKYTLEKNRKIYDAGYNLVEIYECELDKDIHFKSWANKNPCEVITPLNPRDAMFGGRTNVTKLNYEFKKGEKGRYVDFVSLYPAVQFYKEYPIGHPTKILNPEQLDKNWFGFIKCKVLPPKGLYHPVIPFKTKCGNAEKLLFPLCKTCSVFKNNTCNHSDKLRSITGTWCTNELFTALDKGYKLEKIYEVWHFTKTSSDLFKEYIRKFIKIKMESSSLEVGLNCTYKTEQEFKDIVFKKLGITLDNIEYNPGMRAIAKLCLNSLWGKFGQREHMKQFEYVTEPKKFYKILLDDEIDNLNIQFINNDMIQMSYNKKDDFVDNSKDTNIFVACFTTSHARMMLYNVLDKLGDQVLGYDTDSAWYIDRPGGNTIETGDSLGDLTDELEGDYITEWCGTGPKSYAYNTAKGKYVCKVKGFTLNYENSLYINNKSIKELVQGKKDRITIVKEQMITRDAKTKTIVNKYQEKDFKQVYDKRCITKDSDTLPYGY